jgi:hypothetical protein
MTDVEEVKASENRMGRLAYAGAFGVACNIVFRMLSNDSVGGHIAILFVFTFWLLMPVYGVIYLTLRLLRIKQLLRSGVFEAIFYGVVASSSLYFLIPSLNAKQFAPLATLAAACEKETTRTSHVEWSGSVCRDGWLSSSHGPGTCSHHAGIDYNATSEREERFTRYETVPRYTYAQCKNKALNISWLY